MHGNWTVEVRNPDGALVSRWEFENDLVGKESLARLLARENSVGRWQIYLNHGCEPTSACWIIEPDETASGGGSHLWFGTYPLPEYLSNNLTVTLINGEQVELSGTITAAEEGEISVVATLLQECPPGQTGVRFFSKFLHHGIYLSNATRFTRPTDTSDSSLGVSVILMNIMYRLGERRFLLGQ